MPARTGRRPAPDALLRYRAALRLPGAVAYYLTSLPIRLGVAMLNLGVLVLVHAATGSYAVAGTVGGVAALAGAAGGPLTARLADRYGPRRALPPVLAAYAAGVLGLVAAVTTHAPTALWYVSALVAGLAVPQAGSLTRARWAALAPDRAVLGTAFAIESLTDDLAYVVGPVLATLLGTVAPVVCPLATVALVVAGGVGMAARGGTARARRGRGPTAGPLAVPGFRIVAVAYVATGLVFGGLQVGVVAAAGAAGRSGVAGPVYGVFGVASMLAGLAYGAVRWRAGPLRRAVVGFAALASGCALLPAAPSVGVLAGLIVLPGLAVAPTLIAGTALATDLTPRHLRTEAYAWLGAAGAVGVAAGAAGAGRLVETAVNAGFLLPAGAAACAALLLAAARHRIRR
ncbi:MAG TPA: hypothetical protein VGN37_21230 [Actinocatenispora sp.]